MEYGAIPESQLSSSSVLEWTDHTGQYNVWKADRARLKKPGPPWAASFADEHQWLQIDLNKPTKVTGLYETRINVRVFPRIEKTDFPFSVRNVLYT